jgi:LemA protein
MDVASKSFTLAAAPRLPEGSLDVSTLALIALAVLTAGYFVLSYNKLVRSRNQVLEAWSGIDVQLKRRASLIPNLVETVRGYAEHERETLDRVIRARGSLQGAAGAKDAGAANAALTAALTGLFAVVERYPQLQASENFRSLHEDLSDTEDKIAYARQFYNRTVLDYNNRVDVFPTLIVARTLDFRPAEFFEADNESRSVVRVNFDRSSSADGVSPVA